MLCQLVKQYTSAAEEESMYLSLPEGIAFQHLSNAVQNVLKKAFILYVLQDGYVDLNTGKTIILHIIVRIKNLCSEMNLIVPQLHLG